MSVGSRIVEAFGGTSRDKVIGELTEAVRSERVNNDVIHESLRRLEMAMEEEGWRRTTASIEQEFTRGGLTDMIRISRAMYLLHPLVKRAVDVKSYYVWGNGVTFQANEDMIQEQIVLPMMADDSNRDELFGHQAQILTTVDRQVDGNLFFALFTNDLGDVSVRSIPTEQILEILSREGDGRILTYYRRMWTEETMTDNGAIERKQRDELYPDWRYHPRTKPDTFGGLPVNWNAPIISRKTGGFKSMKFGVPETYAALEWARAYKGFLEDWHTIVKSLSRFAFKATTKKRKLKGLRKKLEEEGKGEGGSSAAEEEEPKGGGPSGLRRPRRIGDVFAGGENDDISPIPKTGATVGADDARPSRLMIGASFGLPDTILSGDVDVGNFATSKTLDRPTELMIVSDQRFEGDLRADIFRYCIDAKIRALAPGFRGKEVTDPRSGLLVIEPDMDATVNVTFPPVLEHDQKASVESIVAAATLMGRTDAHVMPPELLSKMLLEALGAEDIEKVLDELPEEETEEVADAIEALREAIEQGRASS